MDIQEQADIDADHSDSDTGEDDSGAALNPRVDLASKEDTGPDNVEPDEEIEPDEIMDEDLIETLQECFGDEWEWELHALHM